MQCLLELREAQVDTEAERRLEHLQQVGGSMEFSWQEY